MQNWGGNVTYTPSEIHRPTSLADLQALVRSSAQVRAVGSRHSFNRIADAGAPGGVLVATSAMPAELEVDAGARVVRASGGLTHAALAAQLHAAGWALPNLASLPHLSVAGAVQTGTHGSGARNPALAASVVAVELVDADGELQRVTAEDADFPVAVVGLGALGVVTTVEHRLAPTFEVEQRVVGGLAWDRILPQLEEVMASAYSVSLFTGYLPGEPVRAWVKHAVDSPDQPSRWPQWLVDELGGHEADEPVHPVPGVPADGVTTQGGVPGPWHERLPHFSADSVPSVGDEIQTEYFVDVERGVEAIELLRGLGEQLAPALRVAEVRRVAPDEAWLSPAWQRDSLALHFTWRNDDDAVAAAVALLEQVLLPLGARPHWGKQFAASHDQLAAAYPRLREAAAVVARRDPAGRFRNEFLSRVLGLG
ncbi:alditol oxidase [Nocardioides nanhaiensis]|uniref:Alditol oxidase n=1 Tax=Nocardioides nanhaiensis TaxID=1476871 RepID=A0ABP8WFJ1_9ACTN